VEIGWTAATFAAVVALAGVVLRVNGRPSGLRGWPIWVLSTALLISAPEQSNVRFWQVSLFLALAVFAGLTSARSGIGPVTVGLATSVKLTPGMFLVDLLIAKRWRQAAYALAALLASVAVAWLWQPAASRQFWGHALFQTDRIGDLAQPGNQSIYGVLARTALPPRGGQGRLGRHRRGRHRCRPLPGTPAAAGRPPRTGPDRRRAHRGAVSPVSWVHQIWTVLAAVTLTLASTRVCRVAGGLVYLIMVLDTNLGAVALHLPTALTWPLTNLRALIVIAFCLWGLPTTISKTTAPPPLAVATLKS
jgi:alpha-1,2-mannosyltransferase